MLPQLGVDTTLYCPFEAADLKQELKLEGFVIGYVGRLMEEKGLSTLIEAFSRLKGSRTLVLVGRGDYKDEAIDWANSFGIADSIRFTGAVPHEKVPFYMNCFDGMVLPSRTVLPYFKEQFGHVLIEAMACEIPVVGSDSGAIPQVIGDAGLIFHEGDVKELAEKLQSLMDDPALRKELALKGRQRVLRKYTHRRIAEEIYHIYQELVSGA
jgi:glycosyltransferase involved in cell wall biosynthesis